jgi:pseudouridine-5'-monophosphatase
VPKLKANSQRFHSIVTGDDPAVKRGKPHPDIFLEACKRLGVTPSKSILVFEDAVNGVEAAKAAGLSVVAIPHPQNDRSAFEKAQPDLILNSMADFEPHLWSMPPFKKL